MEERSNDEKIDQMRIVKLTSNHVKTGEFTKYVLLFLIKQVVVWSFQLRTQLHHEMQISNELQVQPIFECCKPLSWKPDLLICFWTGLSLGSLGIAMGRKIPGKVEFCVRTRGSQLKLFEYTVGSTHIFFLFLSAKSLSLCMQPLFEGPSLSKFFRVSQKSWQGEIIREVLCFHNYPELKPTCSQQRIVSVFFFCFPTIITLARK